MDFAIGRAAGRGKICAACLAIVAMFALLLCTAPANATTHKHRRIASSAVSRKHRIAKASKNKVAVPPAAQAPQPANVILREKQLTVDARNSDLPTVLRQIADATGMTVSGTITSQRIFGTFGPGDPRVVLTRILGGSGQNFVLVGTGPNGAPRELLLLPGHGEADAVATNNTAAIPQPKPSPSTIDANGSIEREIRQQQMLQRLEQIHQYREQKNPPQ